LAIDKVDHQGVGGIAQAMKYQVRTGAGWDELSSAAKESIDQILSSIARTVSSGQGAHWDGIIAYAHAAKPSTEDPVSVPARKPGHLFDPQPSTIPGGVHRETIIARQHGVEAIERSMREIPRRDDDA
jgi:hypothetical protein